MLDRYKREVRQFIEPHARSAVESVAAPDGNLHHCGVQAHRLDTSRHDRAV
ncbi:hypothetical protein W823_12725 [Williamsia sp. D3]|nr:hypothetical protein W823_12725 [Williamsia sp. D3]